MSVRFVRQHYSIDEALFENLAIERAFPAWRDATWRTAATELESLPGAVFRYTDEHGERSVRLERPDAFSLVSLDRRGTVEARIAADDEAACERLLDELRAALPILNDPAGELSVRFWTMGRHHPDSSARSVAVTDWTAIRTNYSPTVVATLDALTARHEPPLGGQLMLWHGPAGTGKTHAIRGLINAWREWVRPEYVVDPEAFFGGDAGYIMSVLLGDQDHDDLPSNVWRLLIFEDTGELLSADARERVGQGLSRMLNSVDGLLGQGLRVLALITTNEDLGRLHPAVTRPGRCSVNIRFEPLDRGSAERWADRHDVLLPERPTEFTVAELFAIAEGRALGPEEQVRIGFSPNRN